MRMLIATEIIKCGGHVAVICLSRKCLRTWNSETSVDDNVSRSACGGRSNGRPLRFWSVKNGLFAGHECELCFYFPKPNLRRNKKLHFINDRTVNTYCFRRKGNETMTKAKTKRTRNGGQAPTERKPHNGCTRDGFEGKAKRDHIKKLKEKTHTHDAHDTPSTWQICWIKKLI